MLISQEGNLVTLISVFETKPEQQQELIDQWIRVVEEIAKGVAGDPGIIGTAVHRSLDGTRVINYVQWRSKEDFERFLKKYRERVGARVSPLRERVDPHLYEVVYLSESAQANARLIQSLLDAFNAKDTDPYLALSTEDFEVLDVPSGMTFKGPEGHRQFVQSWMTAFPDGQVQATSLFTTQDQGHLEYLARGTNTGPFPYASGQIPPTGRRVEFRVSAGLQFREGKVARIHYYYDLLSVLQQLGLVPTKEGRLVPIS